MTTNGDGLMAAAEAARQRAYAPYSKFHVGAALLCDDGTVVTGCNVENASYGLTICAERTAFVTAVNMGKRKFRAVAVASDVVDGEVWPCGACRQFMAEFGTDLVVYSGYSGKTTCTLTLKDLLPRAFTPASLELERGPAPTANK